MSGGWIMEFKRPFIRCTVAGCKRKHYARGLCELHYNKKYRGKYCYTLQEYQYMKVSQRLKAPARNTNKPPENSIKSKTAKKLYQKIKEADFIEFGYKDIVSLTEWKYERVKKYILKLMKLNKIQYCIKTIGGRNKIVTFKLV